MAWPARLLALVVLLGGSGCSKSSSDIRVWRPSDHDQEQETVASGASVNEPSREPVVAHKDGSNAQDTWKSLCVGCHGPNGQGDGPLGASMGTRNLTDARWQTSVTDEQIAASISEGLRKMPAFSLPSETIRELVSLVRGLGSQRP
jgi:mono/diheme cytochrome c family protein